MNPDCLFCKIASGALNTEFLLETEQLVAFRDINPVAPTHILVIPKEHIQSLSQLEEDHRMLMGELILAAARVAEEQGLAQGYRLVVNTGQHGGQTVGHLHFHLLGGRSLTWPPG